MPSPFIFVDTSAWYALADTSDAHHPAATQFIHTLTTPLVTSTYILDETVTLLRSHLGHVMARSFGERLRQEQIALLLRITEPDEQRAWDIFVRYDDKELALRIALPLPLWSASILILCLLSMKIPVSTVSLWSSLHRLVRPGHSRFSQPSIPEAFPLSLSWWSIPAWPYEGCQARQVP